MDWDARTIQTYNDSAFSLAQHFKTIGSRVKYIDIGLKYVRSSSIRSVEIGCGDGRDALDISKRVSWYEGFDPSIELIKIARKRAPKLSFKLANALSYDYPDNIDIVFAFASLLHINKSNLKLVFNKIANSLKKDGILLISLKERPIYNEEVKKDEFGERMFYYYNVKLIKDIAGLKFSIVHELHDRFGKTDWFTLALKKL
jgi:SAM-dependent methyltransferase